MSLISVGPHAPANMAESIEEVNEGGEKRGILERTFAAMYCAIFRTPSFRKSLKFLWTSIAFLDPERNSRNYRHVYRRVWPAREVKPHFGAALVC